MDTFIPFGRILFAIGLVGFGVLHLVAGDFVAGRAPAWPEAVAGRETWAYVSGALLIAAGAAIVVGRRARLAAIGAGTLIFAWALLRHLPATAVAGFLSPQWTQAGKALVFTGGALAIAGSLPPERIGGALGGLVNLREPFLLAGRVTLSIFMVICGIQHFMFDDFVASLVPGWIPGAYSWTYFAGVALIAGGVGMLVPFTARLAAALSGLMIFSWVWLVHLPLITSHGGWLSPFEALALSGLAFVLWRTLPTRRATGAGLVLEVERREPVGSA